MKKLLTITIVFLALLIAIPVAADPTMKEPGYTIEVFVNGLDKPNDLAFDPTTSSLLVSESDQNSVVRIPVLPDGTAGEVTVFAEEISDAEGLALDASGNLFVGDSNFVYKVNNGAAAPFAGEFNDAEGLAIDQLGDLFVADDNATGGIRISKVDILPDGSAGEVSTFAVVPCDKDNPAADIEFNAAGDLFVASANSVWIVEIDEDGSLGDIREFAHPVWGAYALEFDSEGYLFVAGGYDVYKVDSDGNVSQFATGFEGGNGLVFDTRGNLYVSDYRTATISKISPDYLQVSIDIKPGSFPNAINCDAEREVIAVAILTTDIFDATTVDHTTATLEGASEMHVDNGSGEPRRHEDDVDFDGDLDLVLHFRLGDTALTCDSMEATLTGMTFDGQAIWGQDSIFLVP